MNRREKIIFRADLYFFFINLLVLVRFNANSKCVQIFAFSLKDTEFTIHLFRQRFHAHALTVSHIDEKRNHVQKHWKITCNQFISHNLFDPLFFTFLFFSFFFVRDKKRHHLRDPQCAKAIFSFCMKFIFLNGFFRRSYAKLEVCSSNGQMLPLNDFK